MNIAVIGWGSLIWCPGSLRIKTKWRTDGPMLPVEFARISNDGRLTLVIHPGAAPQHTYWAISEFEVLKGARSNLRERESCPSLSAIHYFPLDADSPAIPPEVRTQLDAWLPKHEDVQAVIWTGLETNWRTKRGREFSPEDAIRYLGELETEHTRAEATYSRAKEYVRNTPPSVQTEVRLQMQEKGWTDTKLSDSFFEKRGKEE